MNWGRGRGEGEGRGGRRRGGRKEGRNGTEEEEGGIRVLNFCFPTFHFCLVLKTLEIFSISHENSKDF